MKSGIAIDWLADLRICTRALPYLNKPNKEIRSDLKFLQSLKP